MPAPGDLIALDIEKPAAGGRMLARLDGQIVFVSGTIPGEHVTARVEFPRGGVVFARAESVDVWSPDRRADGADRHCGGNDYAHIAYDRQLTLKRDLVEDAFSRIAKLALPADVRLHASPERGYRMRARLHVDGGQVGFYRQASHDLCDPMSSGQLHEGAAAPLTGVGRALRDGKVSTARQLDLSEDIPAPAVRCKSSSIPKSASLVAGTACWRSRSDRRGSFETRPRAGEPRRADGGGQSGVPGGGTLRVTRQVGAFFQAIAICCQTLVDRILTRFRRGRSSTTPAVASSAWRMRPRAAAPSVSSRTIGSASPTSRPTRRRWPAPPRHTASRSNASWLRLRASTIRPCCWTHRGQGCLARPARRWPARRRRGSSICHVTSPRSPATRGSWPMARSRSTPSRSSICFR